MRSHYVGRRVCVTGGAGFIGGHLVDALLLLGAQVSIIDDLSSSDAEHLAALVESSRGAARFIYGSILDPDALRDAVARADIVFHLAAMTSVPRSLEEPERTFEVNAMGTVRVVEAARRVAAGRLVYAASSSAYGDDPALPKHESMLPRPISPYGASKLAGESVVRTWACSYGLSALSLRLFNVFGPRQPATGGYAAVIPAFLAQLQEGKRPIIFGDGAATRDFTPVANVVQAMLLAGASPRQWRGEAINIALGRRTSVRDLAIQLARLVDRTDLQPEFKPARTGDILHSYADIRASAELLGFAPVRTFEDGLADTAAWFQPSGRLPAVAST